MADDVSLKMAYWLCTLMPRFEFPVAALPLATRKMYQAQNRRFASSLLLQGSISAKSQVMAKRCLQESAEGF